MLSNPYCMLADELGHDLEELNVKGEIYDLANFRDTFEKDIQEKNAILLVTSCYGEGEPTDNAREFFNWIMSDEASKLDWKSVRYAIFGLGNKTCFPERYQQVSRNIRKRLISLGAQEITPMGEGDTKTLDDDFLAWKKSLFPHLKGEGDTKVERESKFEVDFVSGGKTRPFILPETDNARPIDISNPILLKVIRAENLIPKSPRVCNIVEFETDLKYETGDHIGIYPHNRKETVSQLCKRLNVDPNQQFTLRSIDDKTPVPFVSTLNDGVVTVGQAFTQYFSLNHSPKPSFFKYLSRFTENPAEKEYLLDLCEHDENQTKLTNEIKKKFVTVVDILEQLKDVKMSFDQIADILPRMYPRYYSISSSNLVHPHRLHVTVGSLQIQGPRGMFYGLCSNYINRLEVGDVVHGFIRPSLFRLPSDSMHPILIISGGTGIAPFIGFLEERERLKASGVKLGPAALFYGVRDENTVIHGEMLKDAHKRGLISELFIVYSDQLNGTEPKMFVSDRVKQQGKLVWEYLKSGSNIYICGGVSGYGPSVYNALMAVYEKHGDGSITSEYYISKLKKTGRCFEDLAD